MTDFPNAALQRMKRGDDFIVLSPVTSDDLPESARTLLDHTRHMTQMQQCRHPKGIQLEVLRIERDGNRYSREVLLQCAATGTPAVYAILEVRMDMLPAVITDALESAEMPFGEILASSGVDRRIEVQQFVEAILSGEAQHLTGESAQRTYGREITILCDNKPAIRVLEILVNEP